jgi:hypothetical protein
LHGVTSEKIALFIIFLVVLGYMSIKFGMSQKGKKEYRLVKLEDDTTGATFRLFFLQLRRPANALRRKSLHDLTTAR